MTKLESLVEIEGFDSEEDMLEKAVMDSACPGICKTPGCDYTTEVEPDQSEGWCDECEAGTVVSCLVLAGII